MTQHTAGIKAVLSRPSVYDLVQNLLGARSSRKQIAADYIRARSGDSIVDVGCGTGEIIAHLPEGVSYVGFDLSADYIASARERFGDRGRFECMDVANAAAFGMADADVVVAIGLLHHLEDGECVALLSALHALLKPGTGRVVTVDPALVDGQSPAAAFMARRDRGRNVRSPAGYAAIARQVFTSAEVRVRHDLLRIPYTHCILEMTRTP